MRLDHDTRAALDYARSGSAHTLAAFDGLGIHDTIAGEGPHVGLSRAVEPDEQLAARRERRHPAPAASVGMLAVAYRLANLTDDERMRLARGLAAHRKRTTRARLDPAKVRADNARHQRAHRARSSNPNK